MPYTLESPLLGLGTASASAIQNWFSSHNPHVPANLGTTIQSETAKAGLNADIVASQIAHETGWWTSYAAVTLNNPAGIGITNNLPQDQWPGFPSIDAGIHAQCAHLLTYIEGSGNPWKGDDPRYQAAVSAGYAGTVTTIGGLAGTWAYPGTGYGQALVSLANDLVASLGGGASMVAPSAADIGYQVRIHMAGDVGPQRPISAVKWFIVHDTEGNPAGDEQVLTQAGDPIESAHALILPDGTLVFMVPLTATAWTPGNDVVAEQSINVELSGFATKGYSDQQYRSLAAFFRWCVSQGMTVPAEYVGKDERPGIIGHQDVADPNNPGQFGGASHHTDPGPLFDWNKLVNYITMNAPSPPASSPPDNQYFPETGHYVSHGFLRYWQENGGLAIFGYPISEEFTRADGVTVQWFERARFEYQPKLAANQWGVVLGLVGQEASINDAKLFPGSFAKVKQP